MDPDIFIIASSDHSHYENIYEILEYKDNSVIFSEKQFAHHLTNY